MGEEVIGWSLQARGAPEASKAFQSVRSSMAGMNDQAKQLQPRLTGVAAASSALGTALSRVTPLAGAAATALGSAGGAISGLTTAIGGPAGILAGGAVAAFAVFTSQVQKTKEATEELTSSAKAAADSIDELAGALEKAARSRSQFERVQLGAGSLFEQEARVQQLTQLQGRTRAELAALDPSAPGARSTAVFLQQRLSRLEGKIAEAERALSAVRASEEEALINPELDDPKPLRSEREGGSTMAGRVELDRQRDALRRAQQESQERQKFLERVAQVEVDTRVKAAQAAAEAEVQAEIDKNAQLRALREEETENYLAETQRVEDQQRQLNQIAVSGAQAAAGSLISVFQALAKGQEITGAKIVEMIGDQLVSLGTMWIFQGIAESILLNPRGSLLIGVGTAATAAGIAMGAAGAAGAPSGAGAGGGGALPSRPTPGLGGGPANDNGGTVNIYVDAMVADENAGVRIGQAVNAARRVRGHNAVRF